MGPHKIHVPLGPNISPLVDLGACAVNAANNMVSSSIKTQRRFVMERHAVPLKKVRYLAALVTFELLLLLLVCRSALASTPVVSEQLRARGWAVSWDEARSVVEVAYG